MKGGEKTMLVKVLFVDDDANILASFLRQLRKEFSVHTAQGAEEALNAISEKGPFPVVVSDLRMPGMDGYSFCPKLEQIAPDSVRIMLTGNADVSAAIDAVNQGNIFRFLTKPCEQQTLLTPSPTEFGNIS